MSNEVALDFVKWAVEEDQQNHVFCERVDWDELLAFCNRQGIVGIVFDKISRSDLKMEQRQVFEWLSMSEMVKKQNAVVNKRIKDVVEFFEAKGYKSCILKGQANAQMYPNPDLRSPGDIDIWVDGQDEEIIRLVRKHTPDGHYSYHHIEFPLYKDVTIEVHYTPCHLNNWIVDRKLQRYINKIKTEQFSNEVIIGGKQISSLTNEFNAIYQMLHMFGHFFSTRNSFKQLIDYYYLLKQGYSNQEREEIANRFNEFGLSKYASGIMWIMQYVFGMKECELLLEPNETFGKNLLNESLHYGENRHRNSFEAWINIITSNLRYIKYFPSQVIIAPIYLIWHQWWKMRMGIKLKQVIAEQ